jgi:YHS domain-containing protein
MKKFLFVFITLLMAASALNAQVSEIFVKDGYAIGGYDPVAFFTESKPVKGAESISITWKNAKWLFSTQKHADMFKANPEKYAPQYGGYCAYGCSRGYKAKTEADAFTISDGKLYFNYNIKTRAEWLKDTKAYIEKADAEWEKIKEKN